MDKVIMCMPWGNREGCPRYFLVSRAGSPKQNQALGTGCPRFTLVTILS